jgi:hypothetical protein
MSTKYERWKGNIPRLLRDSIFSACSANISVLYDATNFRNLIFRCNRWLFCGWQYCVPSCGLRERLLRTLLLCARTVLNVGRTGAVCWVSEGQNTPWSNPICLKKSSLGQTDYGWSELFRRVNLQAPNASEKKWQQPWRQRQDFSLKSWYVPTSAQGVITQDTKNDIRTAVSTSSFTWLPDFLDRTRHSEKEL